MTLPRFTLTQYLEYVKPLFTETLNTLVFDTAPLTRKRVKLMLRSEENISARYVGILVDILTRTQMLATPGNPFPVYHALCQVHRDGCALPYKKALRNEYAALRDVQALDRKTVIALYTALHKLNASPKRRSTKLTTPNCKTANNILRMAGFSAEWLQTLPSLEMGVKLSAPGFNTLYPTRIDYVSPTGLWDMVVSEQPPHATHLLKLMAYDIFAFDMPEYHQQEFMEVGVINPRLGQRYWLPCKQFPVETYDALRSLLKSDIDPSVSL